MLEQQLGRLTDLLSEQATVRKRRRRQLTLRFLLGSVVFFGLLFAWFGRVYHDSRRQAVAVDHLVSQNAFIHYAPRDNALVSMLPGDAENPPRFLRKWLGDDFFRAVTNVSTKPSNQSQERQETNRLRGLLDAETSTVAIDTAKSSYRRPADAGKLDANFNPLIWREPGLDGGAMAWLQNTRLRWFNASHTRVGDRALYDLSKCQDLQHLDLERTCVSDAGLKYLYSMRQLAILESETCTGIASLRSQQLSAAIPTCLIEWEPLRFLRQWRRQCRRGQKRLHEVWQPTAARPTGITSIVATHGLSSTSLGADP